MPVNSDGSITCKTPTDMLAAAFERVSELGEEATKVVIIIGRERKTDKGLLASVEVFSNAGYWEARGIFENAKDDL